MIRMLLLASACLFSSSSRGADRPTRKIEDKSVEQLAETVRKSVVVIRSAGRDGKSQGLGTGFIIDKDGLIATNLHVIGEARPISVQLFDGTRHDVVAIEAHDRSLDLAIVRIKADNLVPLTLGDSALLKQGQPVVAIGNPRGLENSVVAGVVSGKREIEGRPMIQLAIPLEPGNSGGPLVDMQGRVHGILTLKSLVTSNLGFAVGINSLKPLIEKPNPVPMERWLAIGSLDAQEWHPRLGARWRQRGGRLIVEGAGTGFGGRSLCLSRRTAPDVPFEIAVTVRLDDESGAAGLIFHGDDGDKHYGFYPSGGQLRLTRFQGPEVLSWKILHQAPSPYYRPGEWNTLKVRIEKDKFLCYVNDHLIVESTDHALTGKGVGLAKFRETRAEFKHFQIAGRIAPKAVPDAIAQRVRQAVAKLATPKASQDDMVGTLTSEAPASVALLREKAKQLEQQAANVRRLAEAIHQRRVLDDLMHALQGKEADIDLIHAALVMARLDNDDLDIEVYRRQIDRLARELASKVTPKMDEPAKLALLNQFLFVDNGFHGSRADYYNRSNSYLNDVLDDREGIPITLSVLYIEMARRIGLRIEGVGLPGHFIVRHLPAKGEPRFIDAFDAGKTLSRADVKRLVRGYVDRDLEESDLAPVTKRAILVRMLHNLLGIAQQRKDPEAMLRYLDAIVAIDPEANEERGNRAVLRYQTGRTREALQDVDWLLEHQPEGLDVRRLKDFRRMLLHEGK